MRAGKGWLLPPPLPVRQVHCLHLSPLGLALPSTRSQSLFQTMTISTALVLCQRPCWSQKMTSVALPLFTDAVIPLLKATRLVKQDLLLVKPCWFSHVTSLSSICFSIAKARRICSIESIIAYLAILAGFLRRHRPGFSRSQSTCPRFKLHNLIHVNLELRCPILLSIS